MTDSEWLRVYDLKGKEHDVYIESVEPGIVTGEGGRKKKKPVLHYRGHQKPHAISNTDGKTLESLFGADYEGWVGKVVTIFPSKTERPGIGIVDCIRIKRSRRDNSNHQQPAPPSDTNGDAT